MHIFCAIQIFRLASLTLDSNLCRGDLGTSRTLEPLPAQSSDVTPVDVWCLLGAYHAGGVKQGERIGEMLSLSFGKKKICITCLGKPDKKGMEGKLM